MKKIRKGKKMLLILLIAIAVVVFVTATVFIIKGIVKNIQSQDPVAEQPQIIPLPETTYSGMKVRNIQMQYLKDQDKTMVTMDIDNTTETKVENEFFDAILIGPDENVIGQMQTWIDVLEPGDQYGVDVILKGDLTATTQIKLMKK